MDEQDNEPQAPAPEGTAEQPAATEPVLPAAGAEPALDDKLEPAEQPVEILDAEPTVDDVADRIAAQCAAIIGDQPDAVRNQVMGRLRNQFGG